MSDKVCENQEAKPSLEIEENETKGELNESSITMVDVLQFQEDIEEESAAVLGGSDEKCCTYAEGYVKRQALYSCLTCVPECKQDITKSAGVCLACSYNCHEGHELIELYTKRNFRCDCGTPKLLAKKCTLDPIKIDINSDNQYNQNFSGLYCTCHRPYPDPESSNEDEMIQCIICEDWFHSLHLNATVPENYEEMVCETCMDKTKLLQQYYGICIKPESVIEIKKIDDNTEVNILSSEDNNVKDKMDSCVMDIIKINQKVEAHDTVEPSSKRIKLEENEDANVNNKSATGCIRSTSQTEYKKGATFWPTNWRSKLCKCPDCLKLYAESGISYLLDSDDSVESYEKRGLQKKRETDYERGMRALSSMDRVKQVDAITGYMRMKDKLKDYLQSFVVNQQVVTEEDIKRFFQEIKNDTPSSSSVTPSCR